VPPPSQTTAARTLAPASPLAAPSPIITPSGFSAYERAALRVRNIGCGSISSGSGFAIGEHVFVTNHHVVDGAALLQVSTYDGRDLNVNAVGTVIVADLALVWTQESLPATLQLGVTNPPVGATVTAVGYPLGGELTTTSGRVLGYGPDPLGLSPLNMMYNDAPIEHGSSGSPLVDSMGKLVGVAYAGGGGQYVAVPVETLTQVLNDPSKFYKGADCD
jgi:S1-C subfamily serine protease